MFDSIKSALAADDKGSKSGITDILKTEVGNTYTVRLLPFAKDPKKTFFHYYQHGWNSFATGQYTSAISLQTFGERDPIAEERYKILRTGTEEEKEKAKRIVRSEKWLVNVYVVNDPVNPENNGKVKILRYGKQIHNIVVDAIEGDDSADLGPRIFDLGSNGVNLRVKVEKQGDYPSYVSSKFAMPSAIEGLDEDDHKGVYDNVFDLSEIFNVKSYDELKDMLNEHFYVDDKPESVSAPVSQPVVSEPVASEPVQVKEEKKNQDEDEVLKDLLDGIDI
tara:strand:- start:123 stop:956 length:834 start_codon:yes stop_codon:yes gene_type:complete